MKGHAPNAFRQALLAAGVDIGADLESAAKPRGSVDWRTWIDAIIQPKLEIEQTRLAMKAIRCGAIRTNGRPCPAKPISGKERCRFHGGMSTGPRTPEGRQRIADAQRKRWAKAKGDQF